MFMFRTADILRAKKLKEVSQHSSRNKHANGS